MNIGKETELIEFKKSTSELKEGVISIASILNKHRAGTLYFGVRDDGEVTGQEIGRDTERKISREIAERIKPDFYYEITVRHSSDGKSFVEVAFRGEDILYSAYGRYYERFADEDRAIADRELERLFEDRKKDYSEWEDADSAETLEDVDEELLRRTVEEGRKSGRLRYEWEGAEAALSKMGLYDKKAKRLRNAGRVLFGKNGPVLLKTALYATETRDTFIRLNHFEGNVFECIEEGLSFVLSSIDWRIEITGKAKRQEIPEIPENAVREILVNAFAHGCYQDSGAYSVEVYKDRVSVYSPGFFPSGFTPEDFAEHAAEPMMLNPKIVRTLFASGAIESFGTGFRKTFKACAEAGVRYSYENTRTGFRFVFYRPSGVRSAPSLNKTEEEMLSLLRECDYLSNEEMAGRLGKSEKTVYRTLRSLSEKGLIERREEGGGYWKIL